MSATTDVVKDSLEPKWEQPVLVPANADGSAVIDLEVKDSDAGVIVDGSDDPLGFVPPRDLSSAPPDCTWASETIPLKGRGAKKGSSITIWWARYSDLSITIKSASGLRNADGMFGKSDPYVKVGGLASSRNPNQVWGRTRTVENHLSPVYNETFEIKLLDQMPRGGKIVSPLNVSVWDSDDLKNNTTGKDDLLGEAVVSAHWIWYPYVAPKNFVLPLTGRKAKGSIEFCISRSAGGGSGGGGVNVEIAEIGKQLFNQSFNKGGGGNGIPAAAADDDYPGGDDDYPGGPPTLVSKGACKAVLAKGYGFKIADCCDTVPDTFTCGLAWDVTNGVNIDLDASALMLGRNKDLKDLVYFGRLASLDGSIRHGGDEREGDEKGDDERIYLDLGRVHKSVHYIGICINSYSGQELNDVANCKVRLMDTNTQAEAASFDISSDASLDCCAMLMAVLYRVGDDWWMHAIGEGAHGTMAKDNVDEFQDFINSHDLVGLATAKAAAPTPTKKVRLKVPPNSGNGPNKIAFKSGNGQCMQEVTVPATVIAGSYIEVPVVEIVAC